MSQEDRIQSAIADLAGHRFSSVRKAAAFHDVPRSTLQDRLDGKPTRRVARVSQQILSSHQEEMLVRWCLDLETVGQAPNHAQIREMASLILRINGVSHTLGKNWIPHFLRRNPRVKTKKGRALDRKRTQNLSSQLIQDWFQSLSSIIEQYDITADAIWNMDEIGTALGPCANQMVVGSASTRSSSVKTSNEREWCTAIECISALGQVIKPLLIFKAKHVQNQWFIPSETPDWIYTSSQAAFTTNEIGLQWLQQIFIPQTNINLRPGQWRLLLLDGHKSHTTQEFMNFAYLQRVWCFYLLPHASHVLQPLDLTVFSSLKRSFRALVAFENRFDDFEPQKKATFIRQYQNARTRSIIKTNCISGFQAAGIWPLDAQKALSSHWVSQPSQHRSRTPSPSRTTTQFQAWDIRKTPRGPRDIVSAISTLRRTMSLDRNVRVVLQKTSKALERSNFQYAETKRQLAIQQQFINQIRTKKKAKQPINPNQLFISLRDIQQGPIPLQAPQGEQRLAQDAIPPATAIQEDRPNPVDPFLAIANALHSIRYR